jgi:hypothetical protein
MWICWFGICGVFVVGYELPLLWNNLLTLREEIKNETDPLWSIEITWHNVDVYKGCDEEVILEAYLSISVKLQQYAPLSVCSTIWIYTMEKIFPLSFGDKIPTMFLSIIIWIDEHKLMWLFLHHIDDILVLVSWFIHMYPHKNLVFMI